jgi:hypothetical protein
MNVFLRKDIDISFIESKTVLIKLTYISENKTLVHRSYEVYEHDALVNCVSEREYTIHANINTVANSATSNSGFSKVVFDELEF